MTDVVPYTSARPPASFAAEWLLDPAEVAQRIGGTDFVPESIRHNPAAITAALLYGQEVGLGRMQSLAKIAVINGRPTLAAEAQRALILAAGHEMWPEELGTTRVVMAARRRDSDQVVRVTWTLDDAKRAGLAGKQPWRLYPRQMLLARASAELARAMFADVIGGLAATEEVDDEPPPENGTPDNVPGPDRPATRRTRRKRTPAAATPPPTPEEGDGQPDAPEPEPEPQEPAEGAAGTELPPEEAELVEQARRVADRQDVPQGAPAAPAPEPGPPEMITEPQRRKLHALFRERGIADRAERLRYCAEVVKRPVPTSTDLTMDEAGQVIDHLEANPTLGTPTFDDAIADALQRRVVSIRDLWVTVAGFRHKLPGDLIAELGGGGEGSLVWEPLRDDLDTAERNDLLAWLRELPEEF